MNDERLGKLRDLIRDIPDFPKPGVVFKDITTLLKDPEGLSLSTDLLVEMLKDKEIDLVVAMEARGFIFGSPVAMRLGKGFVPVRKPGKLPGETESESYDLEYGTDTLEIHRDAIKPGTRVVILDDVLATGGTAEATARLVKRLGAEITAVVFVVELDFLKGREKLKDVEIQSLIHF